ncbi:MAG: hypothetical protein AAGC60_24515 [Acidobacteriota bacterium]
MGQLEGGSRDFEDLEAAYRERQRAARRLALDLRELPSHLDPHNLRHCRWAVLAPPGEGDRVRSAMWPLIDRRSMEVRQEVEVIETYPRESGRAFLERHDETEGTIEPQNLPYYLLLVGDPDQISFEFQYRLGLGRAVGRIGWSQPIDRASQGTGREREFDRGGLRGYAEAVCAAEEKGVERPREVALFSVENDDVLKRIKKYLIDPVAVTLKRDFADWPLAQYREEEARHDALAALLGGGTTPGLLLVSSHGRRQDPGSANQEFVHGSPVAYPRQDGDGLFTADDLARPRDLHGLIAFFFHCNGAGVPALEDFPHTAEGLPEEAARRTRPRNYARKPFLQPIPQSLLRRGALAIVAHVERAWTLSSEWPAETHTIGTSATVEDSLRMLLSGHRLGHAMRPLARRYLQLSARLGQILDYDRQGIETNLRELGFMWTAVNDARNLIMLGDPAVYLLGQRQAPEQPRIDPELVHEIRRRAPSESLNSFVQRAVRRELERLREDAEHRAALGF